MSKITNIKTTKDYAVVYLIEFGSYSEIPTNWLLYDENFKDKIACRWPNKGTKNIAQKIKNREKPPNDWPVYEIHILRYCSTLESARKAAEDSQYELSSAPESCGRGHRRRKVTSPVRDALKMNSKNNNIYSSSSDDDDNQTNPVPALPRVPQISPSKSTSHLRRNNQKDSGSPSSSDNRDVDDDSDGSLTIRTMACAKAFINSHKSKQDEPGATASGSSGVNDKGSYLEAKRVLEAKLDICVNLLGKLLTEVRDLKQRSVSNINGNSGLDSAISAEVESHLKLDTQEEVTAFKVRLKSCKNFEDELKLFLKSFQRGTKLNLAEPEPIGLGLAIKEQDNNPNRS